MGKIQVEGMKFFAYHGHFEEEQVVGNQFIVDVAINTNCDAAAQSDELSDALDYQMVFLIVKEEMEVPSKLLEHLANRILDRFFSNFLSMKKAKIKVRKMNPPMGGQIESVSVELKRKAKK